MTSKVSFSVTFPGMEVRLAGWPSVFSSLPFLKTGETLASFQSLGISRLLRYLSEVMQSGLEVTSTSSWSTPGCIPLGSMDLWVSSLPKWYLAFWHFKDVLFFSSFFFLFFPSSILLMHKDYWSGDLKTWTGNRASAVGESCLGESIHTPGIELVMPCLLQTSVVNGSHSIEFNRCCVRSLEPNEPSVLTSLPLLKLRCILFPWSNVSHWVRYNSPPGHQWRQWWQLQL